MGTYWKAVNVTKREQWEPPNIKLSGFKNGAGQLFELLFGRWAGDEVRFIADEYERTFELYRQADDEDWPNVWADRARDQTVDGLVFDPTLKGGKK